MTMWQWRRPRPPVVTAAGLGKAFGAVQAVRDVSLSVERGEIFTVLGSTGAGKSTLVHLLCALTEPSAGRAVVAGYDVIDKPRAARRRIGLVTGGHQAPESGDVFHEVARLRQVSPHVLFLDEPSVGFDAGSRTALWHYLQRVRDDGITVFCTTSSIAEAEQADRIAIMDEGAIVAVGTPEELCREVAARTVSLTPGWHPGLHDVVVHFTGRPIRPLGGDKLGAARRFMAGHRQ